MKNLFLVTGGTGFLGFQIIQMLTEQQEKVRTLVLPDDPDAQRLPNSVEVVCGNIVTKQGFDDFFAPLEGYDQVMLHCAAIVTLDENPSQSLYDVNVNGSINIIDACVKHQLKKLVHVASVHCLLELPNNQLIVEPDHFESEKLVGYYAYTKAIAAQYLMDTITKTGLDACIVYPSGLCGPGDYKGGNLSRMFMDYWAGKIPAGIEGGYNFVDVRDVADAILCCVNLGGKGQGYILGGEYVTIREMLRQIHQLTGKKEVKCILPLWVARVTLPFLALGGKLAHRKPVYTRYTLYTLNSNSNYSIEKAKHELGFRPRPFAETLRDSFIWLKANGFLV